VIREVQERGISEDELQQLQVKWHVPDYYSTLEGGREGNMRATADAPAACFTLFAQ